jgi:Ni,Fe-hydrogenase I small subunit
MYGLDHKDGCPYRYTFDGGSTAEESEEEEEVI